MAQNTRVYQVPKAAGEVLRQGLAGGPFEFRSVPHAVFSAKGEGVVATLYTSGKLVVQGADPDFFVARFLPDLAPAAAPAKSTREEREATDAVARIDETTIGSDETGKGDYFGPLVVAAVRIGPREAQSLSEAGVMDSKKLSDARALRLGAFLRGEVEHAVEVLEPQPYNHDHREASNLNVLLAAQHAACIQRLAPARRTAPRACTATGPTLHSWNRFAAGRIPATEAGWRSAGTRWRLKRRPYIL